MQSYKNFVFLSISIFIGSITPLHAQVDTITEDQFEDVSIIPQTLLNLPNTQQFRKVSPRGIGYPLESWGLAWGDFDGDGYPDLWAGNHRKYASLYNNNRDGTFTDLLLENKNEAADGTASSSNPANVSDSIIAYFGPLNPIAADKDSNAADSHGPVWADYDNDGDMDLFESTGGRKNNDNSNNYLFRNNGFGKLRNITNVGKFSPLKYGFQAGRSALWLDSNNDARLDVFISGIKDHDDSVTLKGKLFEQTADGSFVDVANNKGINCDLDADFSSLADLNGDESLDLICHSSRFPQKVYDMKTPQPGDFEDITEDVFASLGARPSQVQDAVIADFDGDLENEIITASIDGNRQGVVSVDANTFYARLSAGRSANANQITLQGVDSDSQNNLSVDLTSGHLGETIPFEPFDPADPDKTTRGELFLGATATCIPISAGLTVFNAVLDKDNPSNNDFEMQAGRCHNLPANNVDVQGLPEINSNSLDGLYIGYVDGQWKIRIKNDNTGLVQSVWMVLTGEDNGSPAPLNIAQTIPADISSEKYAVGYLDKNNNNKYFKKANDSDIEVNRAIIGDLVDPVSCPSITAGDFDNDMDLDLYLVCEELPANAENIVFENDGTGKFTKVSNSAGAISSTSGIGKTVALADYDVDGFLDLYVTNGHSGGSIPNGPDQLFRNRGNNNNWIELDLAGTMSNIHGIGARIELTAGGITQVREMNGGAHTYVQDHQRIHFGLAENTTVSSLIIKWPSGIIDTYDNNDINPVNKLYKATENSGIEVVNLDKAEPLVVDKDEQGYPHYVSGINRGIFLWKETNGNKWRLRTTGSGSQNNLVYKGNITANLGFDPVNVEGIGIESNDTLDYTTDPKKIIFEFNVASAQTDGINFDIDNSTVQSACLNVSGPGRVQVLLGKNQKAVQLPIDLVSLQPCIQQMCNGKTVTILGTEGDDDGTANPSLVGTPGDDVIHGLGGNDSIDGLGGNDTICGGNGNDMIVGGSGKDFILAGSGNDNVLAGTGLDTVYGQAGNDVLNGQSGNDLVNGGPGNDTLIGQNGDDTLNGNAGLDDLNGGSAIDICHGGADDDTTPNNSCETKISIP